MGKGEVGRKGEKRFPPGGVVMLEIGVGLQTTFSVSVSSQGLRHFISVLSQAGRTRNFGSGLSQFAM